MSHDISQLRKGILEFAILALLHQEDAYGRQLIEKLQTVQGLEATAGTVYPLLSRLDRGGLVSTSWSESPHGPPRKYYALSARGRRHLLDQARTWDQLHQAVNRLLHEVVRT